MVFEAVRAYHGYLLLLIFCLGQSEGGRGVVQSGGLREGLLVLGEELLLRALGARGEEGRGVLRRHREEKDVEREHVYN